MDGPDGGVMCPWFETSYTRLLVDMHITDHHPDFMRRFDTGAFLGTILPTGIDACMVYACCHNGNCTYPTRVGHMHEGLGGRDLFGGVVSGLRAAGVHPIAYYTVVYHNESALRHPAWRVCLPGGQQHTGRYWLCCPNQPGYRDFCRAQLDEIVAYDIEGVFLDMTFWPGVCVCPACRERFLEESGEEIPARVDWEDGIWNRFTFARERWMNEFALELARHIKSRKPVTVTHQFSPITCDWTFGCNGDMVRAADYASGDFHGGHRHQLVGSKLLASYSPGVPFEFMTALNESLGDHSSPKPRHQLLREASNTLASGGAFFFIHDLNPDGTLTPSYYETLAGVTTSLRPFTQKLRALRPVLRAGTGLYFESSSKIDPAHGGMPVGGVCDTETNQSFAPNPYVDEVTGIARMLARTHRPFIITHKDRMETDRLGALILCHARFLADREADRIREFVRDGGTLVATGDSSLYDERGERRADFALADVFGVSATGLRSPSHHAVFDPATGATVSHYLSATKTSRSAGLVKATTAEILARVAVPVFAPEDPDRWASIHCNPCTEITDHPAVTLNRFGDGQCLYVHSHVLGIAQHAQESLAKSLFDRVLPPAIPTNAPACVEITIQQSLESPDRWLVSFLNYQDDRENLPVHGIEAAVCLPGGAVPKSALRVSTGESIRPEVHGGSIHLSIETLDVLEMFELET
jgi:hypothetical protein